METAELENTDLVKANLKGADLTRTMLAEADLRGANQGAEQLRAKLGRHIS